MRDTKVIGFLGKKGVGKNYVADLTAQAIGGGMGSVETGALADPIKDFIFSVLDVEEGWLWGTDAEKNTLTRYDWERLPEYIRNANPDKHGKISARQVLQLFGTEICRQCFGDDVWIRALRRRIDRSSAEWFLVTDVRFPNEAHAVRQWGGQVWRVLGPQRGEEWAKSDAHASERMVDEVEFDLQIDNSVGRPLKCLENEILSLLQGVKSGSLQ
jgi:hypothetical protein